MLFVLLELAWLSSLCDSFVWGYGANSSWDWGYGVGGGFFLGDTVCGGERRVGGGEEAKANTGVPPLRFAPVGMTIFFEWVSERFTFLHRIAMRLRSDALLSYRLPIFCLLLCLLFCPF